ncbi:MAG: hypothetical protein KC589_04605 [Nanoarchaeota archaeon]|nr:hypothetical protein [Nanoarchaeota archaeon]
MEDEEYELILKSELQSLKKENKELKEKLKNFKDIDDNSDKKIKSLSEKNIDISKEIQYIKDISKQTLDLIIEKNEHLETKFELTIESINEILGEMSKIVDEIPNEEKLFRIFKRVGDNRKAENSDNKNTSQDKIETKLEEISLFMKNLRMLLSYVKPRDITIEKPKLKLNGESNNDKLKSNINSNNTNPNNNTSNSTSTNNNSTNNNNKLPQYSSTPLIPLNAEIKDGQLISKENSVSPLSQENKNPIEEEKKVTAISPNPNKKTSPFETKIQ